MKRTDERRAFSGSPFERRYGFCRAVRSGPRVLIAGTAPIPSRGDDVAEGAYAQMVRCGEIVQQALTTFDLNLNDVVRTRMYIVDAKDADEVGRAHGELFGQHPPVATMVVVAGLIDPAWRVEIEAEAERVS